MYTEAEETKEAASATYLQPREHKAGHKASRQHRSLAPHLETCHGNLNSQSSQDFAVYFFWDILGNDLALGCWRVRGS